MPRREFEATAPAVIFLLIVICIATDFVHDIASGDGALHLLGMSVGTVLSVTGLLMMLRILRASRSRAQALAHALDGTRADLARYREQAAELTAGLGAVIDRQFSDWDLSPAEREVALLLLKGLSLKEISAVRHASEPTVRQQAQAVYRKSDLTGRAELAAFFLEDLLQPRVAPGAEATPAPIARLPVRPVRVVPGTGS